MKTWIGGVVLFAVVASSAQGAAPPLEVRDEALEPTIRDAIRQLEKKQYKKFVERFLPPDELKAITKEIALDRLAEKFAKDKAVALLAALKSLSGMKPALDKDGKTATYLLKETSDDLSKGSLSFVKVDGRWHLRNSDVKLSS